MAWMQTYHGKAFELNPASAENVDFDDIIHSLSHINRYTGHAGQYSVAEHCCHVSDYLFATYGDRRLALAGLLHDAHECYVGDISLPVQVALGHAFRDRLKSLAHGVDAAILEGLGLSGLDLYDARVKDADTRILLDERNALMGPPPMPWHMEDEPPLGIEVCRWDPIGAELEFEDRFNSLTQTLGARK